MSRSKQSPKPRGRALLLMCGIGMVLTVLAGPGVFVIPVAIAVVLRRPRVAMMLIAGAAVSALNPVLAVMYALVASLGLLVGWGIAKRRAYGHIVAVLALSGFAMVAVVTASQWSTWSRYAAVSLEEMAADMEASGTQLNKAQSEVLLWTNDHLREVTFGLAFAFAYLSACGAVSVTVLLLRRFWGDPGPKGSFARMQTPAWLVWLAIAAALMWLADFKADVPVLKVLSWNMAIAVATLYWTNGTAVVLYGLASVPRTALLTISAVMVIVLMREVIIVMGLFDTWANVRQRIDAFVIARALSDNSKQDV